MSLHVVDHPLAKHLLTDLRNRDTQPLQFRRSAKILSTILMLEATRSLETSYSEIRTPLETHESEVLAHGIAVVPVLRAGLSMLEPALELFPDVAVGYIGLERSHDTAIASTYYKKLPDLSDRTVFCVDPMLATGGSGVQAVSFIKAAGAKKVVFVAVVSAPEGVEKMQKFHPDVEIFTASLDRGLNDLKYILPGLGDFGDRLFGT